MASEPHGDPAANDSAGPTDRENKEEEEQGQHEHTDDNKDRHEVAAAAEEDEESVPPVDENDIMTRMQQLREDMLQLEDEARYVEAEEIRQELAILKAEYNRFDHKSLDEAQQTSFDMFWHDVDEQKQNFEAQWDRRFAEQRRRAHMLIDNLRSKHELQQQELFDVIQRKVYVPKFSTELLSMRNKQLVLGKAQQYVEAEALRKKADKLEAAELDKMRRKAKEDNQLRFNNLLIKQQWERSNLKDKLLSEKQQIVEAKKRAYVELRRRIQNKLANMKKWQTREKMSARNLLPPVLKESLQRRTMQTGGDGSMMMTPRSEAGAVYQTSSSSPRRGSSNSASAKSHSKSSRSRKHANSPPMLQSAQQVENVYGGGGKHHSASARRHSGSTQGQRSKGTRKGGGKLSVRELARQRAEDQ